MPRNSHSHSVIHSICLYSNLLFPHNQNPALLPLYPRSSLLRPVPITGLFPSLQFLPDLWKNSYQGLHLSSCILITVTCFKTGSPFVLLATVALIYLLHTLIELLQTHDCVHVIALDFSKAFDSVRHHSLVSKLATARLS